MNPSEPNRTLLVDSKDTSKMLCISQRKLWSLTFVEEPKIPHVRLGRSVRYRIEDLEAWIASQRKGG